MFLILDLLAAVAVEYPFKFTSFFFFFFKVVTLKSFQVVFLNSLLCCWCPLDQSHCRHCQHQPFLLFPPISIDAVSDIEEYCNLFVC